MINILHITLLFMVIITISIIVIIIGYNLSHSISLDSITTQFSNLNKKETYSTYRDKYYSTLTRNLDEVLHNLLTAVEYRKIKEEVYPKLDQLNDSSYKYNKIKSRVGDIPEFKDIDIVREILILDTVVTTLNNNKHELFSVYGMYGSKSKIFNTVFLNRDMFIKRLISNKYNDKKRNRYISIMKKFIV